MYNGKSASNVCTVVCGPPGAGKTTYVQQKIKRGDVVLDLDLIFSAISGLPVHDKPESLLSYMLNVQHAALAHLVLLGNDRPRSWIVGGFPTRQDRQRIKDMMGPQYTKIVILNTNQSTCRQRINDNPLRRDHFYEFGQMIENWFEEYEPEDDSEEREFSV